MFGGAENLIIYDFEMRTGPTASPGDLVIGGQVQDSTLTDTGDGLPFLALIKAGTSEIVYAKYYS